MVFDARKHYALRCSAECRKAADRARKQTPEYKAYERAYSQTPERKAYERAYSQTPERKAYDRARSQTPERKAYDRSRMARIRATRRLVRLAAAADVLSSAIGAK